MSKFYFLKNNFLLPAREFLFEYPIPINIACNSGFDIAGDTKFLSFSSDTKNLMQLKLSDQSNHVMSLKVVMSNHMYFYNTNFDLFSYLNLSACIAINSCEYSFNSWEKIMPPEKHAVKISIFNNIVIICIDDNLCPRYILHEDYEFGIITDKDFLVIGFFVNNIDAEAIKIFKEHIELVGLTKEKNRFPFDNCEKTIMEHRNYLIKKIIELENVDHWKVLYYGLERRLIDEQFIMDYCYALLEQKKSSDQFVLDIAALTDKDEIHKLQERIAKKVGNSSEIMIEKGQFYNKIWFYLSLAGDMCAEGIIR